MSCEKSQADVTTLLITEPHSCATDDRHHLVNTVSKTSEELRDVSEIKPAQPSRFAKATRWRAFHREISRMSHFSQTIYPKSATRGKLTSYTKRDATSANSIYHLDAPEQIDRQTFGRVRSVRKLQREAVVYSDSNSCAGSKNYSLDSTKSESGLNRPNSSRSEIQSEKLPVTTTGCKQPSQGEHFLPSLILTIPAEDVQLIQQKPQPNGDSSTHYTTSLEQEDNHDLLPYLICDYCAFSTPTVFKSSTHLQTTPDNVNTFRRHSHCGSQSTEDKKASLTDVSQYPTVCKRCNRPCRKPNRSPSHTIYPPTRNRNASCSGIDMLADAILQAQSYQRR
ncbi:hypothetical protein EG68_00121 [Paragonimus skrjabini miyazakii]|uniref:Uncharacterized protein n=1 Tax=Paragonimus skrjabini miyazakii TaxID=59628 RepID=A0A8S9Z9P0_9TREM|nr:hypothetical protein EG68_00121 [Paragonimus skrjabini miyazakii]